MDCYVLFPVVSVRLLMVSEHRWLTLQHGLYTSNLPPTPTLISLCEKCSERLADCHFQYLFRHTSFLSLFQVFFELACWFEAPHSKKLVEALTQQRWRSQRATARQCRDSSLLLSLAPRPKGEEEKGPGCSRSRIRLIISDLSTC